MASTTGAVTLQTPTVPTVLEYSFVAQDGQSRRYVTDDAAQDGGTGSILRQAPTESGLAADRA